MKDQHGRDAAAGMPRRSCSSSAQQAITTEPTMKKQTLCASCGHPATADTSTGNDGSLCAACESRIMKSSLSWRQERQAKKNPFTKGGWRRG